MLNKARLVVACIIAVVGLGACQEGVRDTSTLEAVANRPDADKLYVVDCLLPPQVRQLGGQLTYLAPRRPVKTTALDCEIRGGEYVAYDRASYASSLKVWLPKAQEGDAQAQVNVGEIFERGVGSEPQFDLAAQWYQRAAAQGNARAMINLGNLYEQGLGVRQDSVQALNLYRQASGLDDTIAYASTFEAQSRVLEQTVAGLRQDLAAREAEVAALRNRLEQAEEALGRERNESGRLEQDLQAARQALERRQDDPAGVSPEELAELQAQVRTKEAELAQQRARITQLQNEASAAREALAERGERAVVAGAPAGPTIEMLDPPVIVTRGAPTVQLRSAVRERALTGRVNAPAGLRRLTVNDSIVQVGAAGVFDTRVRVGVDRTPVSVVAVDDRGERASLEFLIQQPQSNVEIERNERAEPIAVDGVEFGRYHALIIGNNAYSELPTLSAAVNDARRLERVLRQRYGFQTRLLINADRYTLLSELNELRESVGPNDNVLIYYAGHGELDRVNERGYWLPVDASPAEPTNWVSNVAITDILNASDARHILVVADSCYSGALSKTALPRIEAGAPMSIKSRWFAAMVKARSRVVMTSGGLAPVVDNAGDGHSIFARNFIEALEDNDQILEGYRLYQGMARQVAVAAAQFGVEQFPEYAPLKHAGHEAGEFFFVPEAARMALAGSAREQVQVHRGPKDRLAAASAQP